MEHPSPLRRRETKFPARVLAGQEDRLRATVNARPDATLMEIREALPTTAALSTLWLELDRLGLTVKKLMVHADEQRRPDVAAARRQWRETLPLQDAGQYIFVDESGVTTDLLRRYARSPRGTRATDHTPCSHRQTHTVVAALRPTELTGTAVFDGPMDTDTFRAYVEHILVPTLRPGDVAVLDNLAVHKQPEVRVAIEQAGAILRFLHRIVLTSIRLNKPSPNSRRSSARRVPAPSTMSAS